MTAPLMVTYALALAAEGVPVLPLHTPTRGGCSCGRSDCGSPGKHPRTGRGVHDATCDIATIRAWWLRWPDANVGARTGTPGGIFAIDLDSLEGELRLAELAGLRTEALIDPTLLGGLLVSTGRGRHHWYRLREGMTVANSAGKLGAGIDVRGGGGYVVAPPSLHATGIRYGFMGGTLESPPSWLIDAIAASAPPLAPAPRDVGPPTSATASSFCRDPLGRQWSEPIQGNETGATTRYGRGVIDRRCAAVLAEPEGGRNYALLCAATTCAGYAATGEIDLVDAREALHKAGLAAGLGERETARTIASGFERGLKSPLRRPPSHTERLLGARSDVKAEQILDEALHRA